MQAPSGRLDTEWRGVGLGAGRPFWFGIFPDVFCATRHPLALWRPVERRKDWTQRLGVLRWGGGGQGGRVGGRARPKPQLTGRGELSFTSNQPSKKRLKHSLPRQS